MQQLQNIVTWIVPHVYRYVIAVALILVANITVGVSGQSFDLSSPAGRTALVGSLGLLLLHAIEQAAKGTSTTPAP